MSRFFSAPAGAIGLDVQGAFDALSTCDAIAFDVDSTVINEEGIDVLAEYLGKGAEVSAWTAKAMNGNTKFEEALAARLELIKPSHGSISTLLQERPFELTPGMAEFMAKLQAKNVDIFLVSGGFRIMIEPIAEHLNIPKANIIANTILFDDEGNYAGFDATEPTSSDGGKARALLQIQAAGNYKKMIMVGDGATDAQAKPPAAAFIGYGGVADRDAVREKADWFVYDFDEATKFIDASETRGAVGGAASEESGDEVPLTTLYVGNLKFGTSEDAIAELFGQYGDVERVFIPVDKMTNRPRGFAFVGYAVKEAAEAAALALNETELDGRTIYARIAEERGKSRPNRISHTSREREWNAEGKDDVRLYVGNLGFDVDENSIRSHFEQYGTITDMYMPLDRETGRGRGFAFVTMPDAEAYRAVSEASFAVIDGREVRINEAQTKTADSGFAGGRRNDRRGNDRNYDRRESW